MIWDALEPHERPTTLSGDQNSRPQLRKSARSVMWKVGPKSWRIWPLFNGKSMENAARPAGTLKMSLASFRFMRSLGISLLNFLNLHGFLRTVHDTLNRSGALHNRESEARHFHRDDISQGGFAPLNPLAKRTPSSVLCWSLGFRTQITCKWQPPWAFGRDTTQQLKKYRILNESVIRRTFPKFTHRTSYWKVVDFWKVVDHVGKYAKNQLKTTKTLKFSGRPTQTVCDFWFQNTLVNSWKWNFWPKIRF